jgi:hypothetical protein
MAIAPSSVPDARRIVVDDDGILSALRRLVRLELELGLTELRDRLRVAAIAVGLALVAVIALVAAIVLLIAAAIAPLVHAPWKHLAFGGGGVALAAVIALAWSAWRLRRLDWPRTTLTSFEENWRWLAAQLRSRTTLR